MSGFNTVKSAEAMQVYKIKHLHPRFPSLSSPGSGFGLAF